MRIMIIQSEIEQAIAEKVLRQMSINDDMELKINLAATRGDEGFTATIDVVERESQSETAPLDISTKVRAARKTTPAKAAAEPAAAETADEDGADAPDEQEASDNADTEESAPTNSIFANLKKPVNTPAE